MKKRSLFWDNYKGVLILLVVFGHFIYSYSGKLPDSFAHNIYIFIYTFHMPAFVFCSGYFSKSEHSRSTQVLTKLFLYYVVFNTLMALFAYFYMGTGIKLLTPYYSYWYILSLIFWRMAIGKLDRLPKGLMIVSVIVTLLLGYWEEFSYLLSIRRTVAFFVFFAAGYFLKRGSVENFLQKRKAWHMVCGTVVVLLAAFAAFKAVDYFKITEGMTLMGAYKSDTDIFFRGLIMLIAAVAIAGLFLVVPNREIPFLSKCGRNSLLIYILHRFITILYYKELFTYKNYTYKYLIYAAIATIVVCIAFSSNKLNTVVDSWFSKAAAAITDKESRYGRQLTAGFLILFTVLLCSRATGLTESVGALFAAFDTETTSDTVEISDSEAVSETTSNTEENPESEDESYVLSAEQMEDINNAVKIAYVGDLILLKDQVTSAYSEETDSYDFDAMFEYAAPYLQDADLAVGVFEGPTAGEEAGYSTSNFGDGNSLYLNFPDEFAQAVKDSGIDLVTAANNHLLDMGLDGAMRTLDVLDKVELLHTGSYRNQEEKDTLTIVEADGIRIAVLSYLNSVNGYKSAKLTEEMPYLTSVMPYVSNIYYDQLTAEIEEDFAQAKESGADVIMVMAHMGTQFSNSTNAFQDKWNALFAELGADIVLGDHAHAVQPVEYIGDTVVVNCPGNFANSYIAYGGDATSIVEIYIDKDTKSVIASSVVPMYTQEMKNGYFRALPIYDIMTDSDLYDELWAADKARIQEVQELVTGVMVGETITLKNVRERYFFLDNQYYETPRTLLLSTDAYADRKLYQLIDNMSKIAFIGDSITEGTKNDGHPWYEPMMEEISDKEIINISKGGYTVKRIMDDYSEDILTSESDLYVIALGTNDIRYRNSNTCAMTAEAYVEAMDEMVQLILQSNPEAEIVFIAPWMTLENDKNSNLSHEEKNVMTNEYSARLGAYAADNGYLFINANDYLRDFFDGTSSLLYTSDGVHPNSPVGVELYSKSVLESSD